MLYFDGMMTGQENQVFWKQKYDIASSTAKPKCTKDRKRSSTDLSGHEYCPEGSVDVGRKDVL
jgi:hypothetical protein